MDIDDDRTAVKADHSGKQLRHRRPLCLVCEQPISTWEERYNFRSGSVHGFPCAPLE
jgi:hypothetical protein